MSSSGTVAVQATGLKSFKQDAGKSTQQEPIKVAVMTSGGDSAGMNAAVRSAVKMAIYKGAHAYVIREGWEGLVRGNEAGSEEGQRTPTGYAKGNDVFIPTYGEGDLLREGVGEADEIGLKGRYIVRVGWDDVRGWMSEGGTLIGTARCAEFRERSGRLKAAKNLISCGINALVCCGGDGSLSGLDRLRQEWSSLVKELHDTNKITSKQAEKHSSLRVSGIVGSIDGDFSGTDLSLGFPTALTRIVEAIDSISSTASSHQRAFVVEVMGRASGALASSAAISVGADYVFVPERPPSVNWRDEMCDILRRQRIVGKRRTIVILAEGAIDSDLNPIKAEDVRLCLEKQLQVDARSTILGHVQRGGKPVAEDRILATLQGVEAVNAVMEATPETPSYVIGIRDDTIVRLPLIEAVKQTHQVSEHIQNKQFDKALALRDPEFIEGLSTFDLISHVDSTIKLPEKQQARIAILTVGAPAGGMNAAIRTAARYCQARGHTPLAVHNGFDGLVDGQIAPLSWIQVDNWAVRSGSELGTNRHLPDRNIQGVADAITKHKIQGLLLIGGFEAFLSAKILHEQSEKIKALQVPTVHIPATLSSNIPLTESIGFSTSLNEVVNAADTLKRSASASRNRVFFLSCQGGKEGRLAVFSALAAGAVIVYTPETGITLQQLDADAAWLRKRYQLDTKGKTEGRLVMVADKASDAFNLDALKSIFNEEGKSLWSTRGSELGHLCQGSNVSPIDRCRAARLARKACEFIEENVGKQNTMPAIVTINGTRLDIVTLDKLIEASDFANRRPKELTWLEYKELTELMAGKKLI
ncbi:6-phosphofructokinase [Meira miltonrushii]|uniref:6-phosphofructokinase n=1 Tax=Meira miltonrushii TaxID=1280837 RepID=A0A316V684_9BASI|nr:6-phosphofructokinase [Meira miltonrushii]PWN31723.1 6-phosphofructokinase [Meira miltonrushii]